jgi:hypothetical protein
MAHNSEHTVGDFKKDVSHTNGLILIAFYIGQLACLYRDIQMLVPMSRALKLTLLQKCGIGVSTPVWTWNGRTSRKNAPILGNKTNKTNTLLCFTKEKITTNQAKEFGSHHKSLFLKRSFTQNTVTP